MGKTKGLLGTCGAALALCAALAGRAPGPGGEPALARGPAGALPGASAPGAPARLGTTMGDLWTVARGARGAERDSPAGARLLVGLPAPAPAGTALAACKDGSIWALLPASGAGGASILARLYPPGRAGRAVPFALPAALRRADTLTQAGPDVFWLGGPGGALGAASPRPDGGLNLATLGTSGTPGVPVPGTSAAATAAGDPDGLPAPRGG